MAIHLVEAGDRIKASDINQYADYIGQPIDDNIFGTQRGQIIQHTSKVGASSGQNIYFKQVFETLRGDGKRYVSMAFGRDISYAENELGVDEIYAVYTNDQAELDVDQVLSCNWYGHFASDNATIDTEKCKTSGYAIFKISDFDEYLFGHIGYCSTGRIYVVSTVEDPSEIESVLEDKGQLENVSITETETLAMKTNFNIQNFAASIPEENKPFQFDITTFSEMKEEGGQRQYQLSVDWYSYYDGVEEYGVKYNGKDIKHKTGTNIHNGWNTISAIAFQDEIDVEFDVYLNTMVSLSGFNDGQNEMIYNEVSSFYCVELSGYDPQYWCLTDSDIPGTSDKATCNIVKQSQKLAHVKVLNDNATIKQIFHGTQTHISPQYGGKSAKKAFDIENGKVVRCKIMCGNQWCECGDYTIPPQTESSVIYLHITRSSNAYTISVDQTYTAETSTSISIKLWELSANGSPSCDVRPGYIPVFAL